MGARGPGARPPRSPAAKRKQLANARTALRRVELEASGGGSMRRVAKLRRFFRRCDLDADVLVAGLAAVNGATKAEGMTAMRQVIDELEGGS